MVQSGAAMTWRTAQSVELKCDPRNYEHLGQPVVPLVDGHDPAEAAGEMVERLFSGQERDAEGSEAGVEHAAGVVRLSVGLHYQSS